jgi:hypothetical protein
LIAVLFALLACGSGAPAEPARIVRPRSDLKMPTEILPARGVYAAGGGLTSQPWRVTVDYDAQTLVAGQGAPDGAAPTAPLHTTWHRDLTPAEVAGLTALTEHAWRTLPEINQHPTADYDEVIAVVDGDAALWVEGFGPLTGPAAQVVAELHRLAGTPP